MHDHGPAMLSPEPRYNLLVPLSLDLFGRAFEAGDRQRPDLVIRKFNREVHRWR